MAENIIYVLIVIVCALIGVGIWFACINYLIRDVDEEEYQFKIILTTFLSIVPCLAITLTGFGGFLIWLFIPSMGSSVSDFLSPFLIGLIFSIFSYLVGSEFIERP